VKGVRGKGEVRAVQNEEGEGEMSEGGEGEESRERRGDWSTS
jgi:hypothetical protein